MAAETFTCGYGAVTDRDNADGDILIEADGPHALASITGVTSDRSRIRFKVLQNGPVNLVLTRINFFDGQP